MSFFISCVFQTSEFVSFYKLGKFILHPIPIWVNLFAKSAIDKYVENSILEFWGELSLKSDLKYYQYHVIFNWLNFVCLSCLWACHSSFTISENKKMCRAEVLKIWSQDPVQVPEPWQWVYEAFLLQSQILLIYLK